MDLKMLVLIVFAVVYLIAVFYKKGSGYKSLHDD